MNTPFAMVKSLVLHTLVFILLLGSYQAISQTEKVLNIPKAASIQASALPDATDPQVINLKAQPHPASGSELLKQELNAARVAKQTLPPAYQKTGATNSASAPMILKAFQANFANSIPNDNHMAISNGGKVVSVVNSNVRMYDENGGLLFTKGLSAFSSSLGNFSNISDPKVLYDPDADRFVMLYFSGYYATNSTIIVGFSQSNDPTAGWNFYKVPGNPYNDTSWSDYPILTLTKGELFFTFNLLQDGVVDWRKAFKQSVIWQVDKQRGYQGDTLITKVWGDIKYQGKPLWNICPAQGGSALQQGGVYFISVRPSDKINDSVFVTYISNTLKSGSAQLTTQVYRQNKTYGLPPNVPMPNGNYLQTNDARVLHAIIENNVIHYVQNTIDTTYNTAGIYYGRIVNPQNPAPQLTATIIRNDTMDYGYGSVAYVGGGLNDHSVMITCSHTSRNVKPGTSVFFADRNSLISPQVRCKDGEGWINALQDTNERWGDYTAIQRKYNEAGTAWLCGSYGDPLTGMYRSWISKVKSTDLSFGVATPGVESIQATLYPNPASQWVTLEFESSHKARLKAEVYDVSGKLIAPVYDDAVKDGLNRFSFNAAVFKPGMYFLNLYLNEECVQRKPFTVY